ncbi:Eukaryotic aspartyl protease family protein [Striga hermonthica]|uniref:Eukaryotic aspartyl protease family protein n=1 Tax=Striga hermonthica TaxID=68872 RepID=A0A9N7RRP6_STRHE|nr:Eukaryotic aspartyl protease family protein [Striga hermonthica]
MQRLSNRFLLAALLLVTAVAAVDGDWKRFTLTLERASHEGLELSRLRELDRVRHGRFLQQQQQPPGVVDFLVDGTYDPYLVGLYFTRVKLGNPPKEFYVQIDTGSDVLWVSCSSCSGCPTSSGLQIELEFFDPSGSSTASVISCSNQRCASGEQTSDSLCTDQNRCGYRFQYGDGSGTSGVYLSDQMYLDSVVGNSLTTNSSASIVFGCSTSQTGDLTKSDRAVDGIFGFGQQGMSVISQLASQGIVPNAFSHCLRGGNGGRGGILVLGLIVEPNIVYTPLVPSQPHYNVDLQSIAINGQILPIASSVFETSSNTGTIIDSGTTLAYFSEEAYDPFINAVEQTVSQSISPTLNRGNQCYLTTSSVSDIFPTVSLNFAGGASMVLRPQDYLLPQNSVDGATVWCIGIQKLQGQGITILGDLILKDKIVVYDLASQRIGWANYDCSLSVNVSTTSNGRTEFVNAGQIDSSSVGLEPYKLISSKQDAPNIGRLRGHRYQIESPYKPTTHGYELDFTSRSFFRRLLFRISAYDHSAAA